MGCMLQSHAWRPALLAALPVLLLLKLAPHLSIVIYRQFKLCQQAYNFPVNSNQYKVFIMATCPWHCTCSTSLAGWHFAAKLDIHAHCLAQLMMVPQLMSDVSTNMTLNSVSIKLLSHPVFGDHWCPALRPCIYTWRTYRYMCSVSKEQPSIKCVGSLITYLQVRLHDFRLAGR